MSSAFLSKPVNYWQLEEWSVLEDLLNNFQYRELLIGLTSGNNEYEFSNIKRLIFAFPSVLIEGIICRTRKSKK